jgi:succinoglycan biosynthesis protein ExoO
MVVDDCHLIEDGATRPWGSLLGLHGLRIETARTVGGAEFVRVDLGPTKPLIRRELLVRHAIAYDETLRRVEDFAFSLECLLSGARLVVVPEAYYFYRGRGGATCSSDRIGVLREHVEVAERLARDPRVRSDPELRRALARVARRDRAGMPYYEMVGFVRARRIAAAARVVVRSPNVIRLVASHLPIVLRARLSRAGLSRARLSRASSRARRERPSAL